MTLPLDDLDLLNEPRHESAGVPLQLPVDDIDEDPQQPRNEFDAEPLQHLTTSIAQHGVLQAISVRRHPEQPERWMVNFGARRLRASKMAGKTTIAAYVNQTPGTYDQVTENEQREGLKPLELALFVQRRLAIGDSQAEIARCLGKSAPYVTYATALIDAPHWLMTLYRQGRCRGLRELHELRQIEKQHPECVRQLHEQGGPITREVLVALKGKVGATAVNSAPDVAQKREIAAEPSLQSGRPTLQHDEPARATEANSARSRAAGPLRAALCLWAQLDGQIVEVLTEAAPPQGRPDIRAHE